MLLLLVSPPSLAPSLLLLVLMRPYFFTKAIVYGDDLLQSFGKNITVFASISAPGA